MIRMSRKFQMMILACVGLAWGCAEGPAKQADPQPGKDSIPARNEPKALKPEFHSPEGVISDGQFLYISNVGKKLEPTVKDNDGYIIKTDMEANAWIDRAKWDEIQLDAPKGMAIVGKSLFVADIDRVVEIDLKKTEQTYIYDFSRYGVHFLNDICVKDANTLFVSATDANKIFTIDLQNQQIVPFRTGELRGPNGIVFASEENKLYCAEYGSEDKPNGRIIAIDGDRGTVKALAEHEGYLDGLALTRNGEILFSDWVDGKLHKLNMVDGNLSKVKLDSVGGPADFHYLNGENAVWLPCMQESRLTKIENI